jgi:hypothetical protein
VLDDSVYNYQVAAVDIHGNISPLSNTVNLNFNNAGTLNLTVIMEGFYDQSLNNMRMSDTIKVYLRNSSSPYTIADSSRGVINSNTFTGSFSISNATTGNYYISVKHRNTIETWSSSSVSYTSLSTINYNFTNALSQAYGNNLVQADASPVIYAVYSGDVNQDGFIDLTDVILVYNDASAFVTGYNSTDVNGDSISDLTDVIITYNNSIKFISVIRP